MRMFAFARAGAVAAGLGPRLTAAAAAGAQPLEPQLDRDDGARGRLARGERHLPDDGQRLVGRGERLAHPIDREGDRGEVDVDLVGERFRNSLTRLGSVLGAVLGAAALPCQGWKRVA